MSNPQSVYLSVDCRTVRAGRSIGAHGARTRRTPRLTWGHGARYSA